MPKFGNRLKYAFKFIRVTSLYIIALLLKQNNQMIFLNTLTAHTGIFKIVNSNNYYIFFACCVCVIMFLLRIDKISHLGHRLYH